MNFKFILSRLKNATISEIRYRISEKILSARLKKSTKYGDWPLKLPKVDWQSLADLRMSSVDMQLSEETVQGLLQGDRWRLQTDIDAITDFEKQVQNKFFADITYDGPDIRAVWEIARLQHVAALMTYARHAPESDIAKTCNQIAGACLTRWIKANPFLFGPHWASVMECGLRVPVFVRALLYPGMDSESISPILSALYHHAWWIEKRLSLYSSLGNHTICECVGLVFAGAVFGASNQGNAWLTTGIRLLDQELMHQILSDGGPAEQSINYHRFVLDLYWLTIDFLESNHLSDCTAWKPRLLAGEAFIHTFLDASGNIPSIGDSDDGHAIAPGISPKRGTPERNNETCVTFPETGYTVIQKSNRFLLTFDHGPLGMAPLYNHGHADALSITLSVNGQKLLVDPGTYRYNGVPEWRRYFKGTRAHNTVTIDGQDQAIQETGFIWSHPYSDKLVRKDHTENGLALEARHDGYARLKNPVIHTRSLLYDDDAIVIIRDSFAGKGVHEFELNFHLHPDCRAVYENGIWSIQNQNATLYLALLSPATLQEISGKTNPILGWYSPAYNCKQTCSVLQAKETGTPEHIVFVTAMGINQQPNRDKLKKMVHLP